MSARYFELWDLVSGNLAAEFDDEAEAMRFLVTVLKEEGEESVAGYGLDQIPSPAESENAVSGTDLVKRVVAFARSEVLSTH
jgi:hypothetical protein